jgi:hypothetical protein
MKVFSYNVRETVFNHFWTFTWLTGSIFFSFIVSALIFGMAGIEEHPWAGFWLCILITIPVMAWLEGPLSEALPVEYVK